MNPPAVDDSEERAGQRRDEASADVVDLRSADAHVPDQSSRGVRDPEPHAPGREDPDAGHPTRRARLRRETIEQIKESARALLAPHHSGELSLRAVARDVGIAPSGIYRYFDSRQQLVAAVAHDAYASARRALDRAMDDAASSSAGEQALALAHAYRRWCLEHRAEFSLLFATESLEEAGEVIGGDQLHPFFGAPVAQFVAAIRAGAVDLPSATLPGEPRLSASVESLRRSRDDGLSARESGVLLSGWASLHGFVALELFGPLAWFYEDMHESYDRHARSVLTSMGFRGLA